MIGGRLDKDGDLAPDALDNAGLREACGRRDARAKRVGDAGRPAPARAGKVG